MGIDLVVFCLATVDGAHVECMAENERNAFHPAEVSDPVPGEQAFNADDQIILVGRDQRHESPRVGFDVLVDQNAAALIQDADIEATGVQINTSVMFVRLGVEFHRGLLLRCCAYAQVGW